MAAGASAHPVAGQGQAGDAAFDQFYASQFPSIANFAKQQEINRDALIALLDKIGPSILLTHSQSGAFSWPVADGRPDLVSAHIAVEPNGPPVATPSSSAHPSGSDAGATKPYGLGEVAAHLRSAGPRRRQLDFVRQEKPDKPDFVRCWLQQEPARKLAEPRQASRR